ncbi:MAG: hypothetical protein K0S33_4089 [Bacteroidetes bacterium]|jgi:polyhydroxybutyrate depolymerase|nr:hypothetical protein [Bacteroidota bacterium]
MKKSLFLLAAILLIATDFTCFAQWTNKNFTFGGNNRQYRVYVPAMYNASNPASLVLTLHGLGDNMTNFSGIGMNYVADTANIIVVVPQAVSDPFLGTAWNSGAGYMGYFPNSTVNDVVFISALIDTIQTNYSINPNRVYSCGFSMGGFMTERLACELSNRFTAIASVAGTIGNGITNCNPQKFMPVVHFHGTADQTVTYTPGNYGLGADSLVNFWVNFDQCNSTPVHTNLPDIAADGYTVEHFLYSGGQQGTEVEFFKVNGAVHEWLSPANDIFYTTEIWHFFNKHQVNPSVSLKTNEVSTGSLVYPNPASDHITISCKDYLDAKAELYDIYGHLLHTEKLQSDNHSLMLKTLGLAQGTYFLKISKNGIPVATHRIISAD